MAKVGGHVAPLSKSRAPKGFSSLEKGLKVMTLGALKDTPLPQVTFPMKTLCYFPNSEYLKQTQAQLSLLCRMFEHYPTPQESINKQTTPTEPSHVELGHRTFVYYIPYYLFVLRELRTRPLYLRKLRPACTRQGCPIKNK